MLLYTDGRSLYIKDNDNQYCKVETISAEKENLLVVTFTGKKYWGKSMKEWGTIFSDGLEQMPFHWDKNVWRL